jgi:hypothetical protein
MKDRVQTLSNTEYDVLSSGLYIQIIILRLYSSLGRCLLLAHFSYPRYLYTVYMHTYRHALETVLVS